MLRGVHTQSAGVGRGLVGRVRPRRNLSTQAPKEEPNPSTLPPPAEEPITHTVESLTESYYAFQDSVLNIQIMGNSVPRFWVGLVAFGLFGLGKDLLSLGVADQIEHRPDLTTEQKLQLSALAGDKEDFVLTQLPTAVSMSDPFTLLTLPLLSSLFAASVGIWWGRFRIKKLFDKFVFMETKKGHVAPPEVIDGARKGIITRGSTATAVGTMALTTTYISFYAIITRVWFRDYVEQMNEWKWTVPAGKEGELQRKLPSDLELKAFSAASFVYFVFIQLLVLKFTPFVILPSLTALFPLTAVLAQSPVFLRMQDKTKGKLETLEAKGVFGTLPSGEGKELDFDGEGADEGAYGLHSADHDDDLGSRPAAGDGSLSTKPNNVFDKTAGATRVRAIVSRRKREQSADGAAGGGDEEHGKENQWGDVVLEDEQNQQQ